MNPNRRKVLFIRWCTVAAALLFFSPQALLAARTVVTFAFDDGYADQLTGALILLNLGMRATFFIPTYAIGHTGDMSVTDLQNLQTLGFEIGGHTIDHQDLTTLSPSAQQNEICGGRTILENWGLNVVSFAYPDGAYNPSVEAVVKSCGYTSARAAWGLACKDPGCTPGESIPPVDPYAVRTPEAVTGDTTLADLEQQVINVEKSGGGWLPLQFHHVCEGCGQEYEITPENLEAFAAWVQQRASLGTTVETMNQVITYGANPPSPGRPRPRPLPRPRNPILLGHPSMVSSSDPEHNYVPLMSDQGQQQLQLMETNPSAALSHAVQVLSITP